MQHYAFGKTGRREKSIMKKEKKQPEEAKNNRLTDEQLDEVTGGNKEDVRIIIKDRPKFTMPILRFTFNIKNERDQ